MVFIGILYTTAPAVGAFARVNLLQTTHNKSCKSAPGWFKKWETSGLIAWLDKNGDGKIQLGEPPLASLNKSGLLTANLTSLDELKLEDYDADTQKQIKAILHGKKPAFKGSPPSARNRASTGNAW